MIRYMDESKLDELTCDDCSQPLFLDKEECKAFIEDRLKQGFIVCSCCGAKNRIS
jgi:hypothetical protein